MTSEHESLIYAKVASVALKQKNLEGINIIYIVHFLYSFFNIVLEVFMKSKICLAKSRFGVSQCFAFVLSKENEPKVKDPFAEEFLPLAKPLENSASLCSCSRSFSSHILHLRFSKVLIPDIPSGSLGFSRLGKQLAMSHEERGH